MTKEEYFKLREALPKDEIDVIDSIARLVADEMKSHMDYMIKENIIVPMSDVPVKP
jgi:hypothetical protein